MGKPKLDHGIRARGKSEQGYSRSNTYEQTKIRDVLIATLYIQCDQDLV